MAVIGNALFDGANAVVRAVVEHQIRQETSTAVASSAIPSPSVVSSVASSVASSVTSSVVSSVVSSTASVPSTIVGATTPPAPSPTDSGNQDQTGTSSPLLFFVALGFGVVFTNLWIIVGVKYCFRYNARNRAMRGLDENGEPINMENMPARPHRRRREKKLMTMDEVNEKFPMVKYKTWVSERARDGLPTAGGVSVPPSRAASVRSANGIVPDLNSKERESTDERPNTSAVPRKSEDRAKDGSETPDATSGSGGAPLTQAQTITSMVTKDPDRRTSEDDDDEHIDAALPPELMGTAGDTCAICIDTLENDDDVRGLTCGHAFHAVCLDPWLTNRRACCPLCKADYYTPKPRPPPTEGDRNNLNATAHPSRAHGRPNMPRSPQRTFNPWNRGAPRILLGSGRFSAARAMGPNDRDRQRPRRAERQRTGQSPATASQPQPESSPGMISRLRSQFPAFRMNDMMRRNNGNQQSAVTAGPTASGANGVPATATPSQLEAGVRPSATPAQ